MEARSERGGKIGPLKLRNGNALVWVIVIVIVVVGVVTIGQKFLGWGSPGDPEKCPWLQADRIIAIGGTVPLPQPPKTDLKIWNSFRVDPMEGDQSRGSLQVDISDEGFLFGKWHSEYKVNKTTYTFDAGFTGNVDVTKTYVNESGIEDPSLLYIIAQGNYRKQVYNPSSHSGVGGGEAYLTGWLGPDGKAKGKITLVFDKKIQNVLTWER